MGLFDSIFGKKSWAYIPDGRGSYYRRKMPEATLRKLQYRGIAHPLGDATNHVVAHLLGVDWNGVRTQHWRIGSDISPEDYQRYKDPDTAEIFAMYYYVNGTQTKKFLTRPQFAAVEIRLRGL